MPIYKVKIWYTTYTITEVEAPDTEQAEEQVIMGNVDERQAMANIEAMEFNNEVTLADCQYSDRQELQDREKDL